MSNSSDNDCILTELKPLDQAGKIEILQSLIVNGYEKFEELVKLLSFDQNSPDVIGLQLQYFTYKLIAIHGTGGKFDYNDLVQSWQKQYVKLMEFELTLSGFHFDLIIKSLDKLCILSRDAKYYQLIINHFKIQLERGGSIGDFNNHFHSLINTLVSLKLDKDLHITYLNELNSLMHICQFSLTDPELVIPLIYSCLPKDQSKYYYDIPAVYQPDAVHRFQHLQVIMREHGFRHSPESRAATLRTLACSGSTSEFFSHWNLQKQLNLPIPVQSYHQLFWICQGRPKFAQRAILDYLPRLEIEHPNEKYPLTLLQAILWCGTLTKEEELFRHAYDFVCKHMEKSYKWTPVQLDSIISFFSPNRVKVGTLAEIQRVKYQGIKEELEHYKGMETLFRMEIELSSQLKGMQSVKEAAIEAFDYFNTSPDALPFEYDINELGDLNITFKSKIIELKPELSSILGSLVLAYVKSKHINEAITLLQSIHAHSKSNPSHLTYFPSKPISHLLKWSAQPNVKSTPQYKQYEEFKNSGILEDLLTPNLSVSLINKLFINPRNMPKMEKLEESWEPYKIQGTA
jgi:hypothetical protein